MVVIGIFSLRDGVRLEMVVVVIRMILPVRLEMTVVVIEMLLHDGVQVEMADNVHDEGTRAVRSHETIEVGIGLGSPIAGARVAMQIGIEQDTS